MRPFCYNAYGRAGDKTNIKRTNGRGKPLPYNYCKGFESLNHTKKQAAHLTMYCLFWRAGRDDRLLTQAAGSHKCSPLKAKNSSLNCFLNALTLSGSSPSNTKK